MTDSNHVIDRAGIGNDDRPAGCCSEAFCAFDDQQRSARQPEYTAKVGNVEIAVWKNAGQNGDFFTASSRVIPTWSFARSNFHFIY